MTLSRFRSHLPFCLGRLNSWSRVVVLCRVPVFNRAAIHPTVSVVSRLSRAAMAIFTRSLLGRATKSASVQPCRRNSSAMIRSARTAALSRRNSPAWCSPTNSPSIRSSHVAAEFVPVVESNRVGAQQPPHSRDKVRLGCLGHQVEVIAHQAIGMHLEPRLLARLREGLDPAWRDCRSTSSLRMSSRRSPRLITPVPPSLGAKADDRSPRETQLAVCVARPTIESQSLLSQDNVMV